MIRQENGTEMSDEEIKAFMDTFKQFMNQADVEILNYMRRESTRKYNQQLYQSEADKYKVSLNYYMQEFI